ncbi:hypothetical protein QEN19_001808 [Hanseniaspora menglaensis]
MTTLSDAFSKISVGQNFWSYNWIFLVCWITVLITIIFCVYYINRLFAFVLTKILNVFLFKTYQIIIDIEAIDFSLLFGTIHFKNLVIITKDSTISIVRGTFQWKFWMLRAWLTSDTDDQYDIDQEKQQSNKRFYSDDIYKILDGTNNFLHIEGLEVFLYNNTKAYKHIFESILTDRDRELLREQYPTVDTVFGKENKPNEKVLDEEFKQEKTIDSNKFETVYNVTLLDQLLDAFLPIAIKIKKGSIVVGTPCTKYLLIMNWMTSQTLFHGNKSENTLDLYQLRMNTKHEKFLLSMELNPLYKRSENLATRGFSNIFLRSGRHFLYFLKEKAIKMTNNNKRNSKRQHMIETSNEWKGLSMYINMLNKKESDVKESPFAEGRDLLNSMNEYAKCSKLIECESLSHVYYFDIPGYVPKVAVPTSTDHQGPEVGNSGSAPDMRLDIKLAQAQIFFGPWAYRNLFPILNAMLPSHSRDIECPDLLKPGERRIGTRFRVFVDIQEDCNLKIPTREKSKDDFFLSESEKLNRNQNDLSIDPHFPIGDKIIRPYGWIELDIKEGSSMFFDFNFYPINIKNYNSYSFELIEPVISTSVNHETIFTADFHSFIWEQYSPLVKSEAGQNIISQLTNNSKCNLLREHVTLFIDILDDFSIPYEEVSLEDQYQSFVSSFYEFKWLFKDGYELLTPCNDGNIINVAAESLENNFISFVGDSSEVEVRVPMELFHPNSSTVDFKLTTRFFDIFLTSPTNSTIKNFSENGKIGRGRDLEIIGYYEAFSTISFGNVDNLHLEFNCDQVNLYFYGFVVKYFTNFYENLFGDNSKFKTVEEYQEEMFQNRDHLADVFSDSPDFDNTSEINDKAEEFETSESDTLAEDQSLGSNNSIADENRSQFTLSKDDFKKNNNELDTFINFNIANTNLYFPENITNMEKSIGLHTQDFTIDIRALDYYFDLQIDAEPVYIKKHTLQQNMAKDFYLDNNLFDKSRIETTDGILSSFNCHNHRFLGPPPIDQTYMSKWDFALGSLLIDSDMIFIKQLLTTTLNFDFTLDDMDNMLVVEKIASFAVEFDSFEIEEISIVLRKESLNTNFLFKNFTFFYEELETGKTSATAIIDIGVVSITCLKDNKQIFDLQTSVHVEKTFRYANHKKRKHKQKTLLIKNDSPFHRIWFLLPVQFRNYYIYQNAVGLVKTEKSIPSLPIPLVSDTVDLMVEPYLEVEAGNIINPLDNETLMRRSFLTLEALDLQKIGTSSDQESSNINKKTQHVIFGPVVVDIDVAHIEFITLFAEEFFNSDCEGILDTVYSDVVKGLYARNKTQGVNKKFDTTITSVDLNVYNSNYCLTTSLKINAAVLNIDLNVHTKYELQKNLIVSRVSKFFKAVTRKISFNLHQKNEHEINRQQNMRIILESCEYELINDGTNFVKTFNFGTLSNHLNPPEFKLLTLLVMQSLPSINKVFLDLSKIIENVSKRERELVLQLLIAGNQFDINYDPPVVSKLSTIVRLSKTHVRESRSWRICARLKHIFANLPDHWTEVFMEQIEKEQFTPFELASEKFFDCFKKWSDVEQQITDTAFFYKKVFLRKGDTYESNVNDDKSFDVFFKNFFVKISNQADNNQDSLKLKDLRFNIGPFNKEKLEVHTKINALYARLGTSSLNFWILSEKIFKDIFAGNIKLEKRNDEYENINNEVLVAFDSSVATQKMKVELCLDDHTLEIINHDTNIEICKLNQNEFKVESNFDLASITFRYKSFSLFRSSFSQLKASYVNEFDIESNKIIHSVDLDLNSTTFIAAEDTVKSILIIESVCRSFVRSKHEFGCDLSKNEAHSVNKIAETPEFSKTNIVKLKGFIKLWTFQFNFLSPLLFESKADSVNLELNLNNKMGLNLTASSFSTDISSLKNLNHYLLFTQKHVNIVSTISNIESQSPTIVNLDLAVSLIKFMISDIRSKSSFIVDDIFATEENIKFIKKKLLFYDLIKPEKPLELLFNAAVDIDYLGFLFDFSSQQLLSELTRLTFGLKNCTNVNHLIEALQNIWWYYGVDSFSVTLNDQLLDESQSKILNSSFSGSVVEDKSNKKLNLILESEFFNIMFIPYSFMKFMWFVNQFEIFGNCILKKRLSQANAELPISENTNSFALSYFEKFSKIKFISTNFGLGWIYSDHGSNENSWNENGVVYGYETLVLTHESKSGCLKLENSYVGATPFSKSHNFFKIINKRNYINYMSLPLLSVNYTLTKFSEQMSDLDVKVFGDSLQIFLCENLILVVSNVINSFLEFKKLESRYIMKNSVLKSELSENAFNKVEFFESLGLHRIQFNFEYSGGYCNILSHKDFLNSNDATISLHTPKVTIFINYRFFSQSFKKHNLSMVTNVGDSENMLHPTSVPILSKIIKEARLLSSLKQTADGDDKFNLSLRSPIFKEDENKTKAGSFDFKRFLEKFELSFEIECGSQELALTCEPKAKVEAILGVEKMNLKAQSAIIDSLNSVAIVFDSEKLSSKFHHIFSNTISSYFQLSKFSLYFFLSEELDVDAENFTVLTASSLDSNIDITQIQDVNLFFDIWTAKSNLTNFNETISTMTNLKERDYLLKENQNNVVETFDNFRKYYTKSTFALCFIFILKDVKCIVDLGPDLGCLTIFGTKLWFELTQSSNWSKNFTLNIEDISLSSIGRLQGLVELKNFKFDLLMNFNKSLVSNTLNYNLLELIPFIQLSLAMESLKTSLSLDYHMFMLTEFAEWKLLISNDIVDGKPNLTTFIDMEKIEIYATALVTANLLSIYDAVEKIKLENLKSYYDILHDSNTVTNKRPKINQNLQIYLNALNKNVKLKIGDMYVQISPHSLVYPQVLILENKNTLIEFTEHGSEKVFTDIDIATEKLLGRVTKSALINFSEDDLKDMLISEYQTLAKKSTGGTIVNFPSISTKMTAWKTQDSNIIEFIYKSTFGGLVNIKWNLGPISFIKNIWTIHAVSLKLINTADAESTSTAERDKKMSFFEEESLDERIQKVHLNDKYEYNPLVVPIIDTPNLQDLGNATPPLKWFGINKEKFPGLIYESINEPLQDVIEELEHQYGRLLNKL